MTLYWAILFFVVAVIAWMLGFGILADTVFEAAKIIFWIALVLLIVSLGAAFSQRRLPMD